MAGQLRRVQMLIEPQQHAILARLAEEEGRSVADITRRVIALGIEQWAQRDARARRASALTRADELAARMERLSGGALDVDFVKDLQRLREERDERIAGRD